MHCLSSASAVDCAGRQAAARGGQCGKCAQAQRSLIAALPLTAVNFHVQVDYSLELGPAIVTLQDARKYNSFHKLPALPGPNSNLPNNEKSALPHVEKCPMQIRGAKWHIPTQARSYLLFPCLPLPTGLLLRTPGRYCSASAHCGQCSSCNYCASLFSCYACLSLKSTAC